MKKSMSLSLAILFVTVQAHAAILNVKPGNRKIEGVVINESATVISNGKSTPLTLIGAGLREKKVALFWANVYVAQLFVSHASSFDRSKPLESAVKQPILAMQMSFLRNVDKEKLKNSFKEAMEVNQVELNRPDIESFLNAVLSANDAKEGSTVSIIAEKLSEQKESITYQNGTDSPKTIAGKSGLIQSVFSVWLGVVDDSGLKNLKKKLLAE